MDQFFHIRMLVSMIVSLSLAQLLKSVVKFIDHPSGKKLYPVHLLWVAYLFIQLIDFWWWEFRLRKVVEWDFGIYAYVIIYTTIYFVLACLLLPDDIKEYEDYKAFYYSRRGWFFSILALLFLMDIGDTLIKGQEYYKSFGAEYPVRIVAHIGLCIMAARSRKEWFHTGLVIAFLLYGMTWILRKYMTE